MPDYTIVAAERDVFGELGWIPNFNVKKSKNNVVIHDTYREYFDAPKDYNIEFHKTSGQNREFYKGIDESISQMKSIKSNRSGTSHSPSLQ